MYIPKCATPGNILSASVGWYPIIMLNCCLVIDNIQMLALYKELNGRRIELIIMLQ